MAFLFPETFADIDSEMFEDVDRDLLQQIEKAQTKKPRNRTVIVRIVFMNTPSDGRNIPMMITEVKAEADRKDDMLFGKTFPLSAKEKIIYIVSNVMLREQIRKLPKILAGVG